MLTIFRSNRAEWLAQLLAEQLRLDPPSPFEEIEVVVNTWPTSRWLGEQLAVVNGISALVRFPFPGARLRELVRAVLGEGTGCDGTDGDPKGGEDPWRAERLVWPVLEVLPELLQQPAAAPLRQWMELHPCERGQLNRDHWLLARSLADAIDDYALYRADELGRWLAHDSDTSSALAESLRWQPELARLLADKLPTAPFGLQVMEAVKRLRAGESPVLPLPRCLRLFGLSSMAPIQVELLQALSGCIDVQIFLLTPCPDLWERSEHRRRRLGERWQTPLDGSWLLESPRLEAMLGRMGAEFQLLLEGSGECQLGAWEQRDLFAAPVSMAREQQQTPSLLAQVQQQLVEGSTPTLTLETNDHSLRFLASPGRWREVQLVRDQILQWLAADPTLQPRDVLVMTPQIDRFAPLLASAFNDADATGVLMPWRLTDRSQQEAPGLMQGFLSLLALAADRFTATGLEQLLANPALQELQGLTADELDAMHRCLQRTGFRWGLNERERHGDPSHSLRWCLDRWLLGLMLPDQEGWVLADAAPFSDELTADEVGRWWTLLDKLARWIDRLRSPRHCSSWITTLTSLLEELFGDGGRWGWERQAILDALELWRERSLDCPLLLDAAVVRAVLQEALSNDSGRFGHRSGALTISALEPMRAIPHRVVVLMGLDAGSFPRQNERPGFHLLEQIRRLGDPSSSDQDRYVLLEALLSSRQHLMLSWNARDERSGEPLPPAAPVQQWLTLLREQLGENAMAQVLLQPPANPLDPGNFQMQSTGALPSCDQRLLAARRELDRGGEREAGRRGHALAMPLQWPGGLADSGPAHSHEQDSSEGTRLETEQLERWLLAPQRCWLEQQGLRPGEWLEPIEDLEALDLGERQRQGLLQQQLEEALQTLKQPNALPWQEAKQGDWLSRCAGRGILPPAAAASVEQERLEQRWQGLQRCLLSFGTPQLRSGRLLTGRCQLLPQAGKLQARSALLGWLRHLEAQLEGYECETAVIGRSDRQGKGDQFEVLLHWQPIEPELAERHLAALHTAANKGLKQCWPVPPASGLARLRQWQKGQEAADQAFHKSWQGDFQGWPERERAEMRACFGDGCESRELLNAPGFERAFSCLYLPMGEALKA